MNKQEFSALPPDLQRDVRCVVALGWPLGKIEHSIFFKCIMVYPGTYCKSFRPTIDRSIWAGLLEAFDIHIAPRHNKNVNPEPVYEVWFGNYWDAEVSTKHAHLPTAIVCEVIRRDPLGHLARSGLQ